MPYRFLVLMDEERVRLGGPTQHNFAAYLSRGLDGPPVPKLCHQLSEAAPPTDKGRPKDLPWLTLVVGPECLDIGASWPSPSEVANSVTNQLAGLLCGEKPGAKAYEEAYEEASHVEGWVKALVEDRLGPRFRPDRTRPPRVLDRYQVLVIDAAARLSEAYFQAKADQARPVSRWGDETVRLRRPSVAKGLMRARQEPDDQAMLDDLKSRFALLQKELKSLGEPGSGIATTPLQVLVQRILTGLEEKSASVAVAELQAITEVSWYFLSWIDDAYLGWPEFLLDLSLKPKSHVVSDPAHPSFIKPGGATKTIRDLLLPIAEKTARRYAEDERYNDDDAPRSPRDGAYREFANLLFAQAAHRASHPRLGGAGGRPAVRQVAPPATAFVTTFDVEMELALAHRDHTRPFVVAVPVNLIEPRGSQSSQRATSLWLGYVVKAAKEPRTARELVSAVTSPLAEDWFVLSAAPIDRRPTSEAARINGPLHHRVLPHGISCLGELPFVVRLSGSPLVELPKIAQLGVDHPLATLRARALAVAYLNPDAGESSVPSNQASRAGGDGSDSLDDPGLSFSHALLIEEHHSLRMSLPEVGTASSTAQLQSEDADGDGRSGRGLPRSLTDGVFDGYWRYWAMLGVQLSDPVVRYRLLAQLIGAGLMHGLPAEYRRPGHSGVAVNTNRLSSRAAELMLWSEFDIVTDSCEKPTLEIRHYLEHVRSHLDGEPLPGGSEGRRGAWPGPTEECELA